MAFAFRDGNGPPANTLGANGDYYLDDLNGNVWGKTNGVYTVRSCMKGPTGNQGLQGIQGLTGLQGSAGAPGSPGPPGSVGLGINVLDAGLVADAATDITPAFQALVDAAPVDNAYFLFPPGNYRQFGKVDFSRLRIWGLIGVGGDSGGNNGSCILGTYPGDLLYTSGSFGRCLIQGMRIYNTSPDPAAWCLHMEDMAGPLVNYCSFACGGGGGIWAAEAVFDFAIRSTAFTGGGPDRLGIGVMQASLLDCCSFTALNEGARLFNKSPSVRSSRFEMNHTGLVLGKDQNGVGLGWSGGDVSGDVFEANDMHLHMVSGGYGNFAGLTMQGSEGAPSGMSQVGIYLETCHHCSFQGMGIGGAYSDVTWRFRGMGECHDLEIHASSVTNGGTGGVWDYQAGNANILFTTSDHP